MSLQEFSSCSSERGNLGTINNVGATIAAKRSVEVNDTTCAIGVVDLGPALSRLPATVIIDQGRIGSVVTPMRTLASGDLTVHDPHQGEKTEISTLAAPVRVFKEGLLRMRALEEQTALARPSVTLLAT